jgi:hypothetical protein
LHLFGFGKSDAGDMIILSQHQATAMLILVAYKISAVGVIAEMIVAETKAMSTMSRLFNQAYPVTSEGMLCFAFNGIGKRRI